MWVWLWIVLGNSLPLRWWGGRGCVGFRFSVFPFVSFWCFFLGSFRGRFGLFDTAHLRPAVLLLRARLVFSQPGCVVRQCTPTHVL